MMPIEREIRKVQLANGTVPFDEWYHSLVDKHMQAAVAGRLARVRAGNFGNYKQVGDGVSELKIDVGPGLRVYYTEYRGNLVLLLGGGSKGTQQRDIARAIRFWKEFRASIKREIKEL